MKFFYFFLFLSFTLSTAHTQHRVTGKVLESTTLAPLVGANIALEGTDMGTTTDSTGQFSLSLPEGIGTHLLVSYVGYKSLRVPLNKARSLTLKLQPDTEALSEVVVTAYEANRRLLEIPGSVGILTQREMQRDNDVLIVPALNRIPGVFVQSGSLNTNRITIRGIGNRTLFGSNRVRAYLNDIPLTAGDGETTLEDVDMTTLQRVEVLKGPSGSMYGAGLGGAILMKTASSPFNQTTASNQTMLGSFGLRRNVTQLSTGGERFSLQLNHNYTYVEGFRENNQYERQGFFAMAQGLVGENTQITAVLQLIDLKAFIASSIDSLTFRNSPQEAAANWRAAAGFEDYRRGLMGISVNHAYTDKMRHVVSLFNTFRDSEEPRPFNILRERWNAYGLRTYLDLDLAPKHQLVVGAEYFNELYDWATYTITNREYGPILSDNQERRIFLNLFTKWDWQLTSRLLLTAGFNLNQTDYRYTDLFRADGIDRSGSYGFEPMLSPRLATVYRFGESLMIHASASHGFSPPSLEETLNPDGSINPEIRPEVGMNYELGSRGTLLNGKFYYDISLFNMQVRDLLVARRTAEDAFVGINAGRTSHTGLETFLQYQFSGTAQKGLTAWLTHSFSHFRFVDFIDGDRDFSGNELTGTPRHNLSAGLDFQWQWGGYGNLNYQFVDSFPMRDDNTLFSDSFQVVNLKLGYKRSFGRVEADISGGIQNLFNERYASSILINAVGFGNLQPRYYYPGMPRNWFGSLSLRYRIQG